MIYERANGSTNTHHPAQSFPSSPQGHPGQLMRRSAEHGIEPPGDSTPECSPGPTIARNASLRRNDRRQYQRCDPPVSRSASKLHAVTIFSRFCPQPRAYRFATSCATIYSAGVTAGCRCVSFGPARACSSSSQRLWCSLAQLTSTVPLPIASNAPSIPTVPI